jgi:uncharacterized protein
MIAVDTQILVFAHRGDTPWHGRANQRIAELAELGVKWAIPMHCLVEFYAKVTHPRLYKPPSTPAQATDQIEAWLEAPTLMVLGDDVRTWSAMRPLLDAAQIVGEQTYDARIAAVCLQHGVTELWTNDRDFLRFPALRVRNPLIDIHPTRASEAATTYKIDRRKKRARRRQR